MQFWFNGLPILSLNSINNEQFWFNGLPFDVLSVQEQTVLLSVPYQSPESGGAGAPRRRAQYENYEIILRRQKIREIEELKAAILACGAVAPRMAEKVQEFIPYNNGMSIRALVAELARAQRELEDEQDMLVLALLH